MKNVKKVSKVLCAFGVSTVLLAGVVGAATNTIPVAMVTTTIATGMVLVALLHPHKLTILLTIWALLQYSNNNSLALL